MRVENYPVVICRVNKRPFANGQGHNWNRGDRVSLRPSVAQANEARGIVTILTKVVYPADIREAGGVDEYLAQNPDKDGTKKVLNVPMAEVAANIPGKSLRNPEEDGLDTIPYPEEDDGIKRLAQRRSRPQRTRGNSKSKQQ